MKKKILKELSKVAGHGLDGDIVSMGLVSEIIINDDKVVFSITVPDGFSGDIAAIREDAETKVAALQGILAR